MSIHSHVCLFPCRTTFPGLCVLAVIVQTKGLGLESHARSAAVISAAWPAALLANVVHQQKRDGEWGDFSAEYPTQKRTPKDSPSPALPLTHTDKHTLSLLLRVAPH